MCKSCDFCDIFHITNFFFFSNGRTGICGNEKLIPVYLVVEHFLLQPLLVVILKLNRQIDFFGEDRHEVVVHFLHKVSVGDDIQWIDETGIGLRLR